MAAKVIVCPECESTVGPGRFSCTECGALVAAVASESRSFTPLDTYVPPVVEAAPPEPVPLAAVVVDDDAPLALEADPVDDDDMPWAEAAEIDESRPLAAAAEAPPAPDPVEDAAPDAMAGPDEHVPAPPAVSWPERPAAPTPRVIKPRSGPAWPEPSPTSLAATAATAPADWRDTLRG